MMEKPERTAGESGGLESPVARQALWKTASLHGHRVGAACRALCLSKLIIT